MERLLPLLLLAIAAGGAGANVQFHVSLRVPRFVEMGGSALLFCEHSVAREQLHKIEFLRDGRKIFQFVRGRLTPFRNFSLPGAQLDWKHTNERQVMLRNLQFEASGYFSCEVSTETPIYTKASNDQQLTVILKQRSDPVISAPLQRGLFAPGDRLALNCTASPSRPEADITWLVNGQKVEDHLLEVFPGVRKRGDLVSAVAQLTLELNHDHRPMAVGPGFQRQLLQPDANGQLEALCFTTIPQFHGFEPDGHGGPLAPSQVHYADKRSAFITLEVAAAPTPSPDPSASVLMEAPPPSASSSGAGALRPLGLLLAAAAVAASGRRH